MNQLNQLSASALKPPQLKGLACCLLISLAFLPTDDIKGEISMFKEWVFCGVFCTATFMPQQPWHL
jgi:hypothetical protein